MSGWIRERGQEDTTILNDNAKGGNPNINPVIEREDKIDSLMY